MKTFIVIVAQNGALSFVGSIEADSIEQLVKKFDLRKSASGGYVYSKLVDVYVLEQNSAKILSPADLETALNSAKT